MITVKHMAFWAAAWFLAGCTVQKTVTIDPIEVNVDVTDRPSDETDNPSQGWLGDAFGGLMEEAVQREGVAGDILLGSYAFRGANGRWPSELGEIEQGLKVMERSADALGKVTAIQFSEKSNGDCVIKYETSMPSKATMRLTLSDANDS